MYARKSREEKTHEKMVEDAKGKGDKEIRLD